MIKDRKHKRLGHAQKGTRLPDHCIDKTIPQAWDAGSQGQALLSCSKEMKWDVWNLPTTLGVSLNSRSSFRNGHI